MHTFGTGLLNLLLYFVICASLAVLLKFTLKIPSEVFRKILHLILVGSFFVFIFAFDSWWISALMSVGFAAVVYPILAFCEKIKGYSNLLEERKSGEIKKSLLIVFAMFAIILSTAV